MTIVSRIVVGGAGLLLAGVSSAFAAFKGIEWAFGLATMPDNVDETQSKLASFFEWLLRQDPNTAVLIAVGCLFAFGLYMMAWAVRRTATPGGSAPASIFAAPTFNPALTPSHNASHRPDTINPLDSSFEKKQIRLIDLSVGGSSLVAGKTFKDCVFYGPGMAVFNGCRVSGMHVGGAHDSIDNVIIEINDPNKKKIVGAIFFSECTFFDCETVGVGFLLNPQDAKAIREGFRRG